MTHEIHHPKLDEHPGSNTEKDQANWVSGDDPMTGAKASYLTCVIHDVKNKIKLLTRHHLASARKCMHPKWLSAGDQLAF
ncbi:hypothetical protein sphantq_01756 [Sphingobium sp. AntQ-1]|uniref:DUF3072 domain-containing protein n=1 Tax=Sphingobium sp. AntQ-1 TaxID=2930091 RepID=UPI00234F8352|nr:DUF3072 domain-containing protein [Sphingobium sp. AntQ-1]WCP13331.1 hypothetical protein sphantq_01756 [Sphingobium sp. AntQ-1]